MSDATPDRPEQHLHAQERGCSAPHAAGRCMVKLAQPGITAPIASATQVTQLKELLGAASLVLDAEALAALDRVSSSDV